MGVTIRSSRRHFTKPPNASPGGLGFFEPVSLHAVRAVEPNYSNDFAEPCRRHFGGVVLGGDGFFHPYVLSQTLNGDGDSIEMSIGALIRVPVKKTTDPKKDQIGERGLFVYVATYHTPFWTEAHMHSQDRRCIRAV